MLYELSESYFVPLQSVRVTNKNAFQPQRAVIYFTGCKDKLQ